VVFFGRVLYIPELFDHLNEENPLIIRCPIHLLSIIFKDEFDGLTNNNDPINLSHSLWVKSLDE
jgi:hypothetical protein